jgi:hypothetical protein
LGTKQDQTLISGKNREERAVLRTGIHRNGLKQGDETANNHYETVTEREMKKSKGIILGKTTVTFGG